MPVLQSVGGDLDTALLGLAILLLAGVALLLVRVQRTLRRMREADGGVDSDQLTTAVSRSFADLGFHDTVSRIEERAGRVTELHEDLDSMLRNPQDRGGFGEQQLDVILDDHLPPGTYGLRERVVDGKTPDAHVRTSSGLVCIDSKFPLDNYEKYVRARDEETAAAHARSFARDVERQLDKIADDYVRPAAGTTDFAFAFVPSESVYYHLVTEESDMLREYTSAGVQVVSPLTLGHKLELIRAGVHAQELSQRAEEIAERLSALEEAFDGVEAEWDTLREHVRNASNRADDVDAAYRRLRDEFDRLDEPELAETTGGTD